MHEHTQRRTARRTRTARYATAATVAAGLALTALTPTAASAAPRPDVVQQRLDALVKQDGMPAALATVKGRDGRSRTYTAGVGDLATGVKVPVDGQIRAGSNTKAFTAVVVLQLVAEGKVGLDATVDTYLPGLLRGEGIDGRNITVRQLLQHTSGLPDYMDAPAMADFTTIQYRYFEPRELLDGALAQKALFAPGTDWMYSNTNYLVAGLLIQKVTGRPYGEEVTKRIIDRIGLRHTYVPATGETALREPHPHGYLTTGPDVPLIDYTEMDTSMAWAAGMVVSTNTDLNAFYSALLTGRLLPAAQLAQMRTTVPTELLGPGVRYGLGLQSRPLSCGGLVWGHGGTIVSYRSRGGVTEDGRAVNITVTTIPDAQTAQHMTDAVDAALCR
ncbi:serine hydrolase domain-containing protein [Kitasatospora cheerisanensis]|uniref:Beta-lactamase n=1 Tax=Kitasatospora cheerisanensis KCTC 2395 TaxID=1348663 RepID=A0A066Z0C0_9ACTN|nr:serine hydrolase domain-containing protein [Kitasatospora cheerisanensis]KDN86962.1 beta-lactamase [Kitasatospora cheerisanensis KCTC 2395]